MSFGGFLDNSHGGDGGGSGARIVVDIPYNISPNQCSLPPVFHLLFKRRWRVVVVEVMVRLEECRKVTRPVVVAAVDGAVKRSMRVNPVVITWTAVAPVTILTVMTENHREKKDTTVILLNKFKNLKHCLKSVLILMISNGWSLAEDYV